MPRSTELTVMLAIVLSSLYPLPINATTAQDAADFLDSIGVNTHLAAPATAPLHASALRFLGISHARDSLFVSSNVVTQFASLHQATGVTFDLTYDDYTAQGGSTRLTAALANLIPYSAAIEAIEGPNEPDWFGLTFDGVTGANGVVAAQKAIYNEVRDMPVPSRARVYCPAFSFPAPGGLASTVGGLSAFCDRGSMHSYMQNPSLGIHTPFATIKLWAGYNSSVTAPGLKQVITEGGWTTCPDDPNGTDEMVQAKYAVAYLLDAFMLDIERTYLYELFDDVNDPGCTNSGGHYGLFRRDGTAKPAAMALHRLHTVLAAPSGRESASASAQLAYQVVGLPAQTGHELLLKRKDGVFILALWNDVLLWDRVAHTPLQQPSVTVTVTFTAPVATMSLEDPLLDGTPATLQAANAVTVQIPDHPVLLIIRPAS